MCAMVMIAFAALAQSTTTDKVSASMITLNPGGDVEYLAVRLTGNTIYSAVSMDIYLPDGLEFAYDEDDDIDTYIDASCIYTSKRGVVTSHTLVKRMHADKNMLATACLSLESLELTAKEGLLMYVGVKASPFAKPGNYTLQIKSVHLTTKSAVDNVADNAVCSVNVTTQAQAAVKVSAAAHWSTCVLPFDVAALPDGLEAYSCSEKDDVQGCLVLSRVNSMEAYQPYILYSEDAFAETLSGTVDVLKYPDEGFSTNGYLCGAVVGRTVDDGYVLQNGAGGVMFYKVNNEAPVTVPAGKCWATFPQSSAKPFYSFLFDTTGTEDVKAEEARMAPSFTIDGVKAASQDAGTVFISNGKKFVK